MLRLEIVGRRNLHRPTRIVARISQPDGGLGSLIKSFVSMQATSYKYVYGLSQRKEKVKVSTTVVRPGVWVPHPVAPVDPAMGGELGKADILYNLFSLLVQFFQADVCLWALGYKVNLPSSGGVSEPRMDILVECE